jgi:hypothetical protein
MFGIPTPAGMCEECSAANKKAQMIGVGAGLLLGATLCFTVLKFATK